MPNEEIDSENRRLVYADSSPLKGIIDDVEIFAPTDKNILITGASGTGKELVARLIHQASKRSTHPFSAINCAGIPEGLLESTLFGHERGAFTGAHETVKGAFETANGGTLFLDEVAEMSPAMQAKLLRVLQEKKITRVGGRKEIDITARIVAATNVDIDRAVKEGKLRKDLYHRLAQVEIDIPELKLREDDIPLLVGHFANKTAQENNFKTPEFTPASMKALGKHHWPGNVRELQNTVEAAVIRAHHKGTAVTPDLLRWSKTKPEGLLALTDATTDLGAILTRHGSIPLTEVAKYSGVSRPTIYGLMNRKTPGTAEALGLYLLQRGDDPMPFFNALMRQVAEKAQRRDSGERGV